MEQRDQHWLVAAFEPVCLFSPRMTKGGKTLLVPTPYAVKMALIDACFRMEEGHAARGAARRVFDLVKGRRVRIQPPPDCIVQNTFVKALDAERDGDLPFKQTIVYREFAFFSGGSLEIAVETGGLSDGELIGIERLFWHINSLDKRGSFWQCSGVKRLGGQLPPGFTCTIQAGELSHPESYGLIQVLDDFGEALCNAKDGFDRMSTYGEGTMNLGRHRVLATTALPYKVLSAGKRFTWYQRISPRN
jgi:hypothetical protein